jgi:hypothetical protein
MQRKHESYLENELIDRRWELGGDRDRINLSLGI